MSKRRKNSKMGVVALLLIGLAGASGLAYYAKFAPKVRPDEPQPSTLTPSRPQIDVEKKPSATRANHAIVFVPHRHGLELTFERRSEPVPAGENPMVFAVNGYLKQLEFIPSGARLVGIEVIDGVAHLSFNPKFEETYGSEEEKTLLDGLRLSLGQFGEVKKMLFFIEGKPMESLGHVELAEGITVLRETPADSARRPEAPTPQGSD